MAVAALRKFVRSILSHLVPSLVPVLSQGSSEPAIWFRVSAESQKRARHSSRVEQNILPHSLHLGWQVYITCLPEDCKKLQQHVPCGDIATANKTQECAVNYVETLPKHNTSEGIKWHGDLTRMFGEW